MQASQMYSKSSNSLVNLSSITILIISDQPVSLMGIRLILRQKEAIQIVGEVTSNVDVVEQVNLLQPRITLMDCHLTRTPEITLSERITSHGLSKNVIALCPLMDQLRLRHMRDSGITGFLWKTDNPEVVLNDLLDLVKRCIGSDLSSVDLLYSEEQQVTRDILSDREWDVLMLLAEGYRNRKIAELLAIQERTVRFHLERIFVKLGVESRTEAVSFALRKKWLFL